MMMSSRSVTTSELELLLHLLSDPEMTAKRVAQLLDGVTKSQKADAELREATTSYNESKAEALQAKSELDARQSALDERERKLVAREALMADLAVREAAVQQQEVVIQRNYAQAVAMKKLAEETAAKHQRALDVLAATGATLEALKQQ
jgi:hypothetical protein